MRIIVFKYREVLVTDGDLVEIPDTTLIGPPQVIIKEKGKGADIYLVWAEKVEEMVR